MAPVLNILWFLNDEEHKVEFKVYPGRPAVMYMPNGDPGYPEDPAELEVISVHRPSPQGDEDVTDKYSTILEEDDNFREAAWGRYEAMGRACSKDKGE